jgi:hypothetical protein
MDYSNKLLIINDLLEKSNFIFQQIENLQDKSAISENIHQLGVTTLKELEDLINLAKNNPQIRDNLLKFSNKIQLIQQKIVSQNLSGSTDLELKKLLEQANRIDQQYQEKINPEKEEKNKQYETMRSSVETMALSTFHLSKKKEIEQSIEFNQLYLIEGNEQVNQNVTQVFVLDQNADGTKSGFENCGFHALKNALIMLLPSENSQVLKKFFNDQILFLNFYQKYCLPKVEHLKIGKRDATAFVLREVIKAFLQDEQILLPELEKLQKSLMQAEDNSISILQMHTSDGSQTGEPLFSFLDDFDTWEGTKLYNFAKNPMAATFTMVIGNASFNHWYTINVHKDSQSQLTFYGSDSNNESHKVLGTLSILNKITNLIKSTIQDPEEFLIQAYEPCEEIISRYAGWIDQGEAKNQEYKDQLLTDKLEIIFPHIHIGFQSIMTGKWLASDDFELYLKILDLESIVQFYCQNLPSDNSQLKELHSILKLIQENKKNNFVNQIFESSIKEIEKFNKEYSSTDYERIISTFQMMYRLYKDCKQYSSIEESDQRLNKMMVISQGTGIEDDFVKMRSGKETEKFIELKANTLLLTYQRAKKMNKLKEFFQAIKGNELGSDPCFTAKMGRVELFRQSISFLANIEDKSSQNAIDQAPIVAISDILASADIPLSDITKSIFNEKEFFDLLVKNFSIFSNAVFCKFLVEQGFSETTEKDKINWTQVVSKLVTLPEFDRWFLKGKEDAATYV